MLDFIWTIIKYFALFLLVVGAVTFVGLFTFYMVSHFIASFATKKRKKRRDQYELGLSGVAKEKFGNNKLTVYRKADGSLFAIRYSTWGRKDMELPDVSIDEWVQENKQGDDMFPDDVLYGVNWKQGYLWEISATFGDDIKQVKRPLLNADGNPLGPGHVRLFRMDRLLAIYEAPFRRFSILNEVKDVQINMLNPPDSFQFRKPSGESLSLSSKFPSEAAAYLFLQDVPNQGFEVFVFKKDASPSYFHVAELQWEVTLYPKTRTVTHTHRSYGKERLVKRSVTEQFFDLSPTPSEYKKVQDVYETKTYEQVYDGTDITITLVGHPEVKFEMHPSSDVSQKGAGEQANKFVADFGKGFQQLSHAMLIDWKPFTPSMNEGQQ